MSDEIIILCWTSGILLLIFVIPSRESLNLDIVKSEKKNIKVIIECMPYCSLSVAHSGYTNPRSQRHVREVVAFTSGSF